MFFLFSISVIFFIKKIGVEKKKLNKCRLEFIKNDCLLFNEKKISKKKYFKSRPFIVLVDSSKNTYNDIFGENGIYSNKKNNQNYKNNKNKNISLALNLNAENKNKRKNTNNSNNINNNNNNNINEEEFYLNKNKNIEIFDIQNIEERKIPFLYKNINSNKVKNKDINSNKDKDKDKDIKSRKSKSKNKSKSKIKSNINIKIKIKNSNENSYNIINNKNKNEEIYKIGIPLNQKNKEFDLKFNSYIRQKRQNINENNIPFEIKNSKLRNLIRNNIIFPFKKNAEFKFDYSDIENNDILLEYKLKRILEQKKIYEINKKKLKVKKKYALLNADFKVKTKTIKKTRNIFEENIEINPINNIINNSINSNINNKILYDNNLNLNLNDYDNNANYNLKKMPTDDNYNSNNKFIKEFLFINDNDKDNYIDFNNDIIIDKKSDFNSNFAEKVKQKEKGVNDNENEDIKINNNNLIKDNNDALSKSHYLNSSKTIRNIKKSIIMINKGKIKLYKLYIIKKIKCKYTYRYIYKSISPILIFNFNIKFI
jgi:hypothetical protein